MNADSPSDFLEQLVLRESFSGQEAAAACYMVEQMLALGYQRAYIDNAGSPIGLWNCDEPPQGPYLLLLGHIDTVRGWITVRREQLNESEWEAITGADTVLHGRGSVDAKGPLATFVQAVSRLDRLSAPLPIVVVGAVEEESSSSKGARQVLNDFSEPLAVIIGEPSHTRGITLGYKGRLVANFYAERLMTHGAHRHESAAEIAFRAHQIVLTQQSYWNEGKEGAFLPLDYTIQSLQTESDGLTESVRMVMGFRLGPDFNPSEVFQTLTAALKRALPETTFELSVTGAEPPAQFDKKLPLVRHFRNAVRSCGLEPKHLLKTGTSDMNVLSTKWSCPMLAYGPGDSALDHTPEERISLREYELAIEILTAALQSYLTEQHSSL